MSSTAFLSVLMVTFACIGFVLAVVMGRLGHSPFAWGCSASTGRRRVPPPPPLPSSCSATGWGGSPWWR
jgi:hypothetical protein